METQQQSMITIEIDGQVVTGLFDTLSGGETSASPAKRRAGGMGGWKSFASLPDFGDVTVGRNYERLRDHEMIRRLHKRCGKARGTINEQPLDEDGNPWGQPVTRQAKLMTVNPGDADSQSSDVRMYTLGFQILDIS